MSRGCLLSVSSFVSWILLVGPGDGTAQPARLTDPEPALILVLEKDLACHLDVAREQIEKHNWPVVTTLLQKILDAPQDAFVLAPRKGPDGKEARVVVSLRSEAGRLLEGLPRDGLAYHEKEYGPRAAELLKQARILDDVRLLGEVSSRFLHTSAGLEATERLALRQLDRGQLLAAALSFDRLLRRAGAENLPPGTLFRAILSFGADGEQERLERVWKILEKKLGDRGLDFRGKTLTLAELRKEVEKRRPAGRDWDSWFHFRGDPARSGQSAGGTPRLEPLWSHPLAQEEKTRDWLKKSIDALDILKQPVLPALHPITLLARTDSGPQGMLVYRSYWGLHARSIRKQGENQPGELFWQAESHWSVDKLLAEPRYAGQLTQALQQFITGGLRPGILFESTLTGTLSTDGRNVFSVEDLQVPPYLFPNPFGRGFLAGPLDRLRQFNQLQAFEMSSGKLMWELGSLEGKLETDYSLFLSAPLALDGKLLVLNEKEGQLRLLTLDPATGDLLAVRPLAKVRDRLPDRVERRLEAAHLAQAEGILVCPTNAGGVFGINLSPDRNSWVFLYEPETQERPALPPGGIRPPLAPRVSFDHWRNCAPILHGSRVLLGPPDSGFLFCLGLSDGRLIWKVPRRAEDRYVGGVVDGVVLVVGVRDCRGLSLVDGKEVWKLETGTPSGLGVIAGGRYYLPLARESKTVQPGITILDVGKGKVVSLVRSRNKEAPGNLAFVDNTLISLSATHLTAYPLLGQAPEK